MAEGKGWKHLKQDEEGNQKCRIRCEAKKHLNDRATQLGREASLAFLSHWGKPPKEESHNQCDHDTACDSSKKPQQPG